MLQRVGNLCRLCLVQRAQVSSCLGRGLEQHREGSRI